MCILLHILQTIDVRADEIAKGYIISILGYKACKIINGEDIDVVKFAMPLAKVCKGKTQVEDITKASEKEVTIDILNKTWLCTQKNRNEAKMQAR